MSATTRPTETEETAELTAVTPADQLYVRWMIRRDLDKILPLDQWGTGSRWDEADFLLALKERNTIGFVAEEPGGEIAGYLIYSLHAKCLLLHKLCVRRDVWGNGYGRRLLDRLFKQLATHRRPVAVCDVPEHNMPAQLLLRSCGWIARPTVGDTIEFRLTAAV